MSEPSPEQREERAADQRDDCAAARARRALFMAQTAGEAFPMTPIRRAPEGQETALQIADAADDALSARNLTVLSAVNSVQGTQGKRWALTGLEPNRRATWKWFEGQLKTTLLTTHPCFRYILTVDESTIPPGTVFSRVANSYLYMVLLQLTTENARRIIETHVTLEAQDGHRALVHLAKFYSPTGDSRVDDLTCKIMAVHIGTGKDPQSQMMQLQTYREEFFTASCTERD